LDNDLAITSTGVGIFVRGDGATINGNALSGASNFEIGIWGFGTEDNITDNAMSSLGGTRGVGIFSKDNSNDTVTGNTVNEAGFGIEGVMGNTVHGNTFYNVAQLTKP
jgi:parallel beta-helix repeat protein